MDTTTDIKEEAADSEAGPASLKRSATSLTERGPRKRRAVDEQLNDSLSTPPTYGLRHRQPDQQTASASEERASRLARRAKPVMSIENLRRSSLRTQNSSAIDDMSEEDEADDDDYDGHSGSEGKGQTFDKKYVDAHPNQQFYHAGNGWYKLGKRSKEQIAARERERKLSVLTLTRERDGSFSIDGDKQKSVHRSQLDQFPGIEFHHTGNGWYKLGPDPSGHRQSKTIPAALEPEEAPSSSTYDKAYAKSHPEFEWVHRGNGRYIIKPGTEKTAMAEQASPGPSLTQAQRRKSEPTYTRDYVQAHPGTQFYHTGNGRYKKGIRPGKRASMLDESEDEPEVEEEMYEEEEEEEEEEEDEEEEEEEEEEQHQVEEKEPPDQLFDKAYVLAHPLEKFHHRGQGRYARGPHPAYAPKASEPEPQPEEVPEVFDASQLYDGAYVDAHPHLNFYHRGQGRWARGLPPPGSHSKTAIRGPAAHQRMEERRVERKEKVKEKHAEPVFPGPPDTILLTKAEIDAQYPAPQYPHLFWIYRGGGKWGLITKAEAEARKKQAEAATHKHTNYRRKSRKSNISDGPDAQLEREAAAAGLELNGDTEMLDVEQPKMRRKRKFGRGNLHFDVHGSKTSSNSQSKVQTPKRMLAPEEDVLGPEDEPPIFRDHWSPDPQNPGDRLDAQLRNKYHALNTDLIVASLTKHDPAVRSTANLKRIAANAALALRQLQDEYLALDRITAPHAKIPRKPVKGGRVPVDPQIFEDKKEAELYDYVFDPRKIGCQDPEAQKIMRDAEGRELRKRRNRSGIDPTDTVPGWHFGEGTELAPKRASRQPQRFENLISEPARKRMRTNNGSKAVSMTPERGATPVGMPPPNGVPGGKGVPAIKRVRELRDESVGSTPSEGSSVVAKVSRKGRPPGSKNLHRRKDFGIKKGPRKPKLPATPPGASSEGGQAFVPRQNATSPSAGELPMEAVAGLGGPGGIGGGMGFGYNEAGNGV
jgi:hypothetical protein